MQQITNHAQTRLQQRGIPEVIVDSLLEYGREIHDHRGASILYFDMHARPFLRDTLSHQPLMNLESHFEPTPLSTAREQSLP